MKKLIFLKILKIVLWLHTICYKLASLLAIKVEGVHPKHRIMRYKEWFIAQINSDDIILDIGSNTGMMPALFAQKASYVYGVEIEEQHIAIAKAERSAKNIEFIQADATKLDYSKLKPISAVTLSNVLEHIENRIDFLKSILARVNWKNPRKPKIIIRVPCFDRDWVTPYKKEKGLEWRLDSTHFTEYTEAQFREEIAEAGITPLSLEIRFGEIYAICSIHNA